jgi:hypothetical protein
MSTAREFVISLHKGQQAIQNSAARFKVCAAGRRFGKSHFAALQLGLAALKNEHRGYKLTPEAGVYYVAPTADQARRVMWPKLRELLGYERHGGFIRKENVNDGWLELINGRRIYIKGADNPDSLRGIGLSFVVLDEYADMKPQTWTTILRPALADYEGDALFIGTPKGKNHFYKLFMFALHYEQPPEHPYPMWEAFHFKSTDNPFLADAELQAMREDPNTPLEIIKQEVDASFLSGGGKVLKPEWFTIVPRLPPSGSVQQLGDSVALTNVGGSFYITVDLAGFVSSEGKKQRLDETVICTTFVDQDGDWWVKYMEHGQWDPRETALRIVNTVRKNPGARLGIEKGALMNAVGPYMNDYMREFGRYVNPEPLSHGNTKKLDRIQWALQGRAERGKIYLVEGDWNEHFLDQCADFPDPLAHDDMIDVLAYVDQMAVVSYADPDEVEEWEVLDLDAGY